MHLAPNSDFFHRFEQFEGVSLDTAQRSLSGERYCFAMLEIVIAKHSRSRWEWRVCDRAGKVIMHGWENSRSAARYRGERALFQLLLARGTQPLQGRQ